jgi:hypothetical protein
MKAGNLEEVAGIAEEDKIPPLVTRADICIQVNRIFSYKTSTGPTLKTKSWTELRRKMTHGGKRLMRTCKDRGERRKS